MYRNSVLKYGPGMVEYELDDGIATITMDDGKANVMSPDMIAAVDAAFDRAAAEEAIVVLTGRVGMFSAGFDLAILGQGRYAALSMVRAGFELAERAVRFPRPVVAAVPGHAIAMGAFLMLAADHRIGVDGPFRTVANEVEIGLTMPLPAVELLRLRLTPAAFDRAAVLSEEFRGEAAVAAGWYTELAAPEALMARAHEVAQSYRRLDPAAFRATKLRARQRCLDAMHAGTSADFDAYRSAV